MKKKYDFAKAKKRKDLKVQKTFRIDPDVLLWLEEQAEKKVMLFCCRQEQSKRRDYDHDVYYGS